MAKKADTQKDEHYEVKAKNASEEDKRFLAEHADELSKTTQRAKWIHSTDEHANRPGQTLATRGHSRCRLVFSSARITTSNRRPYLDT